MALTFVPKNSNAKTAVFLEANFKNEFYTILPPWRNFFASHLFTGLSTYLIKRTVKRLHKGKKKHQICKPFTIIPII